MNLLDLPFQGSSIMGIFILTTEIQMNSALVSKRLINIVFLQTIQVNIMSFPGGYDGGVADSRYSVCNE